MPGRTKETLTPTPRPLVRLRKLLSQRQDGDVRWYYQVGKQLQELLPERWQRNQQHQMKRLAVELKLEKSAPLLLWCARKFAAEYDDQEVERLCREATEAGVSLSRNHVQALVAIKNRQFRRTMEKQCITNHWTTRQLRRKIQEKKGFPPEGGGHIDRPETLDGALQQFMHESRAWLRRCRKVWFQGAEKSSENEVPTINAKMPMDDRENVRYLTERAIQDAEQVRRWAIQAKKELESLAAGKASSTPPARNRHRKTK
jgi:hypothetical protein